MGAADGDKMMLDDTPKVVCRLGVLEKSGEMLWIWRSRAKIDHKVCRQMKSTSSLGHSNLDWTTRESEGKERGIAPSQEGCASSAADTESKQTLS